MLTYPHSVRIAALTLALGACVTQPAPIVMVAPEPASARDALYTPDNVRAVRLEYAPDHSPFAPVMTERFTYPTQTQAQNAFLRSQWAQTRFSKVTTGPVEPVSFAGPTFPATGVKIFACQPGGLDGEIGRIKRYRGPVVVCATDFLDETGTALWRAPMNFYYVHKAWQINDPEPVYTAVPWASRERSPPRSWNPFGDRY